MAFGSRLKTAAAVTFLVLAPMVAACGSDGEPETPTSTISKRQFVAKANAICAQANREIGKVYNQYIKPPYPGGKRPTEEDLNRVAQEVVIPAREKQIRRIRALGAPSGEARRIEQIFEAIEDGIEKGEKDPRSMRGAGTEYAFAKALELEIAYGLEECVG